MEVGGEEIGPEDESGINKIISKFLGADVRIVDASTAERGRSRLVGTHYRLSMDNGTFVGVKIPFDRVSGHEPELIVHDVRELLALPNYRVERVAGFPIDGAEWRGGDCILIEWGVRGSRTDLAGLEPSSLAGEDRLALLGEIATNAALSCLVGAWNRNAGNFVWDTRDKRLFSIDHEAIESNPRSRKIPLSLAKILEKFFGRNWHDDPLYRGIFTEAFTRTWGRIAEKEQEIAAIFRRHGFASEPFIPAKIENGPNYFLKLITGPAAGR